MHIGKKECITHFNVCMIVRITGQPGAPIRRPSRRSGLGIMVREALKKS